MLLAAAMLPALGQANICDRTPQVRNAILLALDAGNCAAVDSEGLASLQRLDLTRSQLTALPAGVFDGLAGLQTLNLQDNQLTELPDGAFAGLTGLKWLELGGNHLVGLTPG